MSISLEANQSIPPVETEFECWSAISESIHRPGQEGEKALQDNKTEKAKDGNDDGRTYRSVTHDLIQKGEFITNDEIDQLGQHKISEDDLLINRIRKLIRDKVQAGATPEAVVAELNKHLIAADANFRLKMTISNLEQSVYSLTKQPGVYLDMVDLNDRWMFKDNGLPKRAFVSLKF